MYDRPMKRLQILIEEDLDAALDQKARSEKTSKAALIRRYVRQRLKLTLSLDADPLWQMVGVDEFEPVSVDDVVYQ